MGLSGTYRVQIDRSSGNIDQKINNRNFKIWFFLFFWKNSLSFEVKTKFFSNLLEMVCLQLLTSPRLFSFNFEKLTTLFLKILPKLFFSLTKDLLNAVASNLRIIFRLNDILKSEKKKRITRPYPSYYLITHKLCNFFT